jgi:DNA mismatch repair ATPase MutS
MHVPLLLLGCSLFLPLYTAKLEQQKALEKKQEQLFKSLLQANAPLNRCQISRDSLYELDIEKRAEKRRCLTSFFDKTATLFGRVTLEHQLTNPIKKRTTLEKRQLALKKIRASDQRTLLHKYLAEISSTEKSVMAYTDTTDKEQSQAGAAYFATRELNNSALALTCKQYTEKAAIIGAAGLWFWMPFLLEAGNNYRITQAGLPGEEKDSCIDFWGILKQSLELSLAPFDPRIEAKALLFSKKQYLPVWTGYAVEYGKLGFALASVGATLYKLQQYIAKKYAPTEKLAGSLEKIGIYVTGVQAIMRIASELGLETETLITEADKATLKELEKIVTGNRSVGSTLVAHGLIKENINALIHTALLIGEIDSYCAVLLTIDTCTKNNLPCCFVDYSQEERPVALLEKMWHPLVAETKPVTNSFCLGGGNSARLSLLTGPHGCGKSTLMRAVMLNALLAQSYGIAYAEKAVMSIFDGLYSYLTIAEDRDKGWSTFVAEYTHAKTILKELQTNTGFSLAIFDELFKGTLEKEGAERIFSFGLALTQLPTTIACLATHAELPTTLEEYTAGKANNWHGEIVEKENGSFEQTFKILKGKNNWWFHDDAKRKRFIDNHIANINT